MHECNHNFIHTAISETVNQTIIVKVIQINIYFIFLKYFLSFSSLCLFLYLFSSPNRQIIISFQILCCLSEIDENIPKSDTLLFAEIFTGEIIYRFVVIRIINSSDRIDNFEKKNLLLQMRNKKNFLPKTFFVS